MYVSRRGVDDVGLAIASYSQQGAVRLSSTSLAPWLRVQAFQSSSQWSCTDSRLFRWHTSDLTLELLGSSDEERGYLSTVVPADLLNECDGVVVDLL